MYFLDYSGHIFQEKSYNQIPVGHDLNEHENVFWIKTADQFNLSTNNYYGRTVNLLIPLDENDINSVTLNKLENIFSVEISCESHIFSLIKAYVFENATGTNLEADLFDNSASSNNTNKTVKLTDSGRIDITEHFNAGDDIQILSSDNDNDETGEYDIFAIGIDDNSIDIPWYDQDNEQTTKSLHKYFALIPIYIVAKATEPGTWITNILIHIKYKLTETEEWSSISVGGQFVEESEILEINMHNFGIKLPKDILHAVYDVSFYNDEFDMSLWNRKCKEYMINYMNIRGECGNFKSALASLDWFGYGNKITVSKLLQTDNELKNQYLLDYFDISYDILDSFKHFKQKAYITLQMKCNEEILDENGEYVKDIQDFNKFAYGEETPKFINLFKHHIEKPVGLGNTEKWNYLTPFYKFSLNEMLLKLACLKEYYEKYFLPLHSTIHSASFVEKTYMDDVKFTCFANTYSISSIQNMRDNVINDVTFVGNGIHWFTEQIHFTDKYLNEFDLSSEDLSYFLNSENEELLYIHDTVANIPIKFNTDKNSSTKDKIYNCVFLLEEINDNLKYNCYVYQPIHSGEIIKFISNNTVYNGDVSMTYSLNPIVCDRSLSLLNRNQYYNHKWFASVEEIYDDILNYIDKQKICKIKFEKNKKGERHSILLNNVKYYIDDDRIININGIYWSITKFDISDKDHVIEEPNGDFNFVLDYYGADIYLKLKFTHNKIDTIVHYNGNNLKKLINNDYIDNINSDIEDKYVIKYSNSIIETQNVTKIYNINNTNLEYDYEYSDKLIFESHFSFFSGDRPYKNFIIYPRLLTENSSKYNDYPIEYWLNKKFRIRLNVNDNWYEYEFELKIPELHVQYGKLEYKYWSNNENWYSSFKQLSTLKTDSLQFNSFMYEPDLVTINNSSFIKDLDEMYKLNNLKYVNQHDIAFNEFYYYIVFNQGDHEYKIYIHNDNICQNIFGVIDLSADSNITSIFSSIEDTEDKTNITFILEESGLNTENEYDDGEKIYTLEYGSIFKEDLSGDYIIFDNDTSSQFFNDHALVILEWNDDKKGYYVGVPEYDPVTGEEIERDLIYLKMSYNVRTSLLESKEITSYNMNMSDKYLNSIMLFDLYHKVPVKHNIWNLNQYSDMFVHGIHFHNKLADIKDTKLSIGLQHNEFALSIDNLNKYQSELSKFINMTQNETTGAYVEVKDQGYYDYIRSLFNKNYEFIDDENTVTKVLTTRELDLLTFWWNDVYVENNEIKNKWNITEDRIFKIKLYKYIDGNDEIYSFNRQINKYSKIPLFNEFQSSDTPLSYITKNDITLQDIKNAIASPLLVNDGSQIIINRTVYTKIKDDSEESTGIWVKSTIDELNMILDDNISSNQMYDIVLNSSNARLYNQHYYRSLQLDAMNGIISFEGPNKGTINFSRISLITQLSNAIEKYNSLTHNYDISLYIENKLVNNNSITDIKYKFYDKFGDLRSYNVVFDLVYYIDNEYKGSFTYNEYSQLYKYYRQNRLKIYLRFYYETEYNEFGIPIEIGSINEFSALNGKNIYSFNFDKHQLEKELYVINIGDHENIFQMYDTSNNKVFDTVIYSNSNNTVDWNYVIDKLYDMYGDDIEIYQYDVIKDQFDNIIDAKQRYWLEIHDSSQRKISHNHNNVVDLKHNKYALNTIIDESTLYINWNHQSIDEINSLLNDALESIKNQSVTYNSEVMPITQSIYKEYTEFLINQYNYENIFAYNLTNIPGLYELEYSTNDNSDAIKMCAVIMHSNNSISIYQNNLEKFEVKSSDKIAKVFLQLNLESNEIIDKLVNNINQTDNQLKFKFALNKYASNEYERLKYIPTSQNDHILSLELADKTYTISDNNDEDTLKLYNRFFEKYLTHINDINDIRALPIEIKNDLLNYFYKQKVNITDMHLQYDLYLMHDNEYWYVIFISRDTIDKIDTKKRLYLKSYPDIFIPGNETEEDLKLSFVRHDTQPMINRLKCTYVENNNKFTINDFIIGTITNNKKLSINNHINSKWHIRNISLGSNIDEVIESNSEMCIINMLNRDNVHQSGYYDVDIRYTLTGMKNQQQIAASRFMIMRDK